MKTKKINAYVEKRFDKMRLLMLKSIKTFDKEAIHKFRLEVKKIRALMRFLDCVIKDFNYNKQKKYVLPFYQQIGAIRDWQIQIDKCQLDNNPDNSAFWGKYCDVLRKDIEEKKDTILRGVKLKDLKNTYKLQKNIIAAIKSIDEKKINTYFKKRSNDIQNSIDKMDYSVDKMHDLRKLIKEYYYNQGLLYELSTGKKKSSKSDTVAHKPIYDDIQTKIGEWHDHENMIQSLHTRFAAMQLQDGEKDVYDNIKTDFEVNKALLKNEITKMLGTHIY